MYKFDLFAISLFNIESHVILYDKFRKYRSTRSHQTDQTSLRKSKPSFPLLRYCQTSLPCLETEPPNTLVSTSNTDYTTNSSPFYVEMIRCSLCSLPFVQYPSNPEDSVYRVFIFRWPLFVIIRVFAF